jgi:ankyrin repeat protein
MLILATEKGFEKVAKLLIDKGADLDAVNNAGMTAEKLAKRNNKSSIVTYIKERTKQNQLVSNALLHAVQLGDQRHAVALINCGAPFENRYPDGCCPIIKSGNFGYKQIIDALIAKGANLNMQSKNGNTSLMKACEKGFTDIVRSLMQAGADPELHSNDGCCALVRAANYGHPECVEVLLEYKCNINVRSRNGNTGKFS